MSSMRSQHESWKPSKCSIDSCPYRTAHFKPVICLSKRNYAQLGRWTSATKALRPQPVAAKHCRVRHFGVGCESTWKARGDLGRERGLAHGGGHCVSASRDDATNRGHRRMSPNDQAHHSSETELRELCPHAPWFQFALHTWHPTARLSFLRHDFSFFSRKKKMKKWKNDDDEKEVVKHKREKKDRLYLVIVKRTSSFISTKTSWRRYFIVSIRPIKTLPNDIFLILPSKSSAMHFFSAIWDKIIFRNIFFDFHIQKKLCRNIFTLVKIFWKWHRTFSEAASTLLQTYTISLHTWQNPERLSPSVAWSSESRSPKDNGHRKIWKFLFVLHQRKKNANTQWSPLGKETGAYPLSQFSIGTTGNLASLKPSNLVEGNAFGCVRKKLIKTYFWWRLSNSLTAIL